MAGTSRTPREKRQQRDMTVNLRASASVRGRPDHARRSAKAVPLDQCGFLLDDRRHVALMDILDAPVKPRAELRQLLARKSPWER